MSGDRTIAAARLRNQHLAAPFEGNAPALVGSFGAMQAQEYPFAKWAISLRLEKEATSEQIERAFAAGEILRTHVMRPTWHFVAAGDISWLLHLTAPRVRTATASYFKKNGLEPRRLARAADIVVAALAGGRHLTRAELAVALRRRRLALNAVQVGMVVFHAELEGLICSGPRRARQFTYALLEDRVRAAGVKLRALEGDAAIAELTAKFLRHHGPATIRDFVWWSGLKTRDARRGVAMINARRLSYEGLDYWSVGDPAPGNARRAFLLPIYDEYLVAYRDRLAVPFGPGSVRTTGRAISFRHAVVIDGQVAGTWRVVRQRGHETIAVTPLRTLRRADKEALELQGARYSRFVQVPVTVTF